MWLFLNIVKISSRHYSSAYLILSSIEIIMVTNHEVEAKQLLVPELAANQEQDVP